MTLEEKQAQVREKMKKIRSFTRRLQNRERFILHNGDALPSPLTPTEMRQVAEMIESAALELDEPIQSNLLGNVMHIRMKIKQLMR